MTTQTTASAMDIARAIRIGDKIRDLNRDVSHLTANLAVQINEVLDFTHFMHVNPLEDIKAKDRALAADRFNATLGELQAQIARLAPLIYIEERKQVSPEAGQQAINDFLAGHTLDVPVYSQQFD